MVRTIASREQPVIGHGDLGPWNILARDSMPVAFIDWDNAGPVDAVWELAQVAWLNAQLHDDVADLNALPDNPARLGQCAAILDGYKLPSDHRVGFVDKMIEFALRSARDEAHTYAITSDTPSPAPDGFPILWAVTWRARAACWMLDHRSEINRTIN
ncbi:MAG TPA: phosphotransferase [Mycobacterium sp.]|nr:phosphotransferase [Mycobacterium sp.]